MQYSLLSRFQGAVVGVSLGSRLTRSKLEFSPVSFGSQKITSLQPQVSQHSKPSEANASSKQIKLTRDESLVLQMSHSLTRCQGWDRRDWQRSWEQWKQSHYQGDSEVEKDNLIFDSSQDPLGSRKTLFSLAEIALATLPLTLLFHEQPNQLNRHLQQGVEIEKESVSSLEIEQAVLAFNWAIAFALREELNPTTLITEILNHLDPQSYFSQQLHQVQTLIEQNVSLEIAQEQLLRKSVETVKTLRDTTLVALALYSFVSTPYEPEIALLRTLRLGQPLTIRPLLGALLGAYNSFSSFPLSWQSQFRRSAPEELVQREIFASATKLFATWSGVYNIANPCFEIYPTLAVAAPNIIRSRQS